MKKRCFLLVICMLALLLCGCAENKEEGKELFTCHLATNAVLEDGMVTVVFADGFRLELGAIEELPWSFTTLEDKSLSVVAASSATSPVLSKEWFATAEGALARFGKEIVFQAGDFIYSFNNGANGTSENGYVISGNVIVQSYEGVGNIVGNLTPSFGGGTVTFENGFEGNVIYRTYELGVDGSGLDLNYHFSASGMPASNYLQYNGTNYGIVEQALVPFLQQELTEVTVPAAKNGATVTTVGDRAFANYAALETVTIPACVTSLGNDLFAGCSSMKKVIYLGTEEQWNTVIRAEGWNSGLQIAVEFQP
ncbi:MAG: hypothetical protein E7620_01315 [Ruminococcaceae bacterium]|nr:hypothetical protein [Oscillospiraceae bacterium]